MAALTPEQGSQNVLTPLPGMLAACPGCGKTFTPRRPNHRYCSAICRLVWFHQKPVKARRDRDAKIRLLLTTVLTTNRMRSKEDADHVRRRIREALELLEAGS